MDEERHADPDSYAYGNPDSHAYGNPDGDTHGNPDGHADGNPDGHAYGNSDGDTHGCAESDKSAQDGRRRRADALAGGTGPVRRRADDAAQKKIIQNASGSAA